MAPFYTPDKIDNVPNWSSASQGYSKSDAFGAAKTGFGEGLKEVGGLIGPATHGIHDAINSALQADAHSLMDPYINEMGGDVQPGDVPAIAGTGARGAKYAVAALGGLPPGDERSDIEMAEALPAGAKAGIDQLRRHAEAYQQGQLSETMKDARDNVVASQLQLKYGAEWNNEIQAAIKLVNGGTANKLRESILRDMNSMALSMSSADNKLRTEAHTDQKYWPLLPPEIRPQSWQDYKDPEKYARVQAGIAEIQSMDVRQKWMENNLKVGQMKADQVVDNFAANTVQKMVFSHGDTLEKLQKDIESQRALGPGRSDPNAVEGLRQRLAQAQSTMEDSVRAYALTQRGKDGSILKGEDLDKIIQHRVKPIFDNYRAALDGENVGLASASSRIIKQRQDSMGQAAQERMPHEFALSGIKKAFGDDAYLHARTTIPQDKISAESDKFVNDSLAGMIFNPDPGAKPPGIGEVYKMTTNDPAARRTMTLNVQQYVQSKDPVAAGKALDVLYGHPEIWQQMAPSESFNLYTMLASPEFTKRVVALDQQQPGSLNKYYDWLKAGFQPVFSQTTSGVNDYIQKVGGVKSGMFEYNVDEGQFRVAPVSNEQSQAVTTADAYTGGMSPQPEPSRAFDGINRALAIVRPAMEAKFGEGWKQEMHTLVAKTIQQEVKSRPTDGALKEMQRAVVSQAGAMEGDQLMQSEGGQTDFTVPNPGTKTMGSGKQSNNDKVSLEENLSARAKVERGPTSANAAHVSSEWGNPLQRGFVAKHLTSIKTPSGKEVRVNTKAAEAFQGFLSDLEATGYKINTIGGYVLRTNKSDPRRLSQHAFGNAIDINEDKNPFHTHKTDMPANVAQLARKWGLAWGGNWDNPDPMHFEYVGTRTAENP